MRSGQVRDRVRPDVRCRWPSSQFSTRVGRRRESSGMLSARFGCLRPFATEETPLRRERAARSLTTAPPASALPTETRHVVCNHPNPRNHLRTPIRSRRVYVRCHDVQHNDDRTATVGGISRGRPSLAHRSGDKCRQGFGRICSACFGRPPASRSRARRKRVPRRCGRKCGREAPLSAGRVESGPSRERCVPASSLVSRDSSAPPAQQA